MMMVTTREIPGGAFNASVGFRDAFGRLITPKPLSKLSASAIVLNDLRRDLDIPSYRLAKLLGMPMVHNIYAWGRRYRISHLYLTRMLHLAHLHLTGQLDLDTFDGSTYWRDFRHE